MSKMFQCYGIGQALIPVLPPPLKFQTAPTSNQNTYEVGQLVYVGTPGAYTFYIYEGAGIWTVLAATSGTLDSLTTQDATVVVPTGGNINLSGAGSLTTIGSGSTATVELTGLTNHAILVGAGTTTITKLPLGTAGEVLTSGGAGADPTWTTPTFPGIVGAAGTIIRSDGTNWVASTDTWPNTVAAGDILMASASNIVGVLADVASGQALMSGGGGNPAYTGSPSFSGSVTAQVGNITATNGNLVLGTSGNKLVIPATTAASDSVGTTAAMTTGAVTITSSAITASSKIIYSRRTLGTAMGNVSITAQAGGSATLTSDEGTETSTFDYIIIN